MRVDTVMMMKREGKDSSLSLEDGSKRSFSIGLYHLLVDSGEPRTFVLIRSVSHTA